MISIIYFYKLISCLCNIVRALHKPLKNLTVARERIID